MQLLQQVVAGRTNSVAGSLCVDSVNLDATRYLLYGSGADCVVYTSEFHLVQSLRNTNNVGAVVGAVGMSPVDGTIAASYGRDVLLFACDRSGQTAQWSYLTTLVHDADVICLSWSPNGQILTAGATVSIWENVDEEREGGGASAGASWRLTWSSRCGAEGLRSASEIIKAAFSPDGRFFATFGQRLYAPLNISLIRSQSATLQFERFVKVWYRRDPKGRARGLRLVDFGEAGRPFAELNLRFE
ncbi:hypothetical protein BDK51DRAFT_35095 [Blyttiomyces helicus]|uniref:WD40-repeat-containing domain protein n=1 Tax=Blyttiomyces helicus TaxID=388810 RepID=A0A4P9W578_9FUNG|nr:hypothetical protein BDK51DRAFT_35095 [Blyttiomyces helicus]|eukprot:RKO87394.1 hypothetical protein BDK51DRAFT_35095 [Blyttiomyces helicus]